MHPKINPTIPRILLSFFFFRIVFFRIHEMANDTTKKIKINNKLLNILDSSLSIFMILVIFIKI